MLFTFFSRGGSPGGMSGGKCSRPVPDQWKIALINPIPKINNPTSTGDLRSLSIVPILSRIFGTWESRGPFTYVPWIQQTTFRNVTFWSVCFPAYRLHYCCSYRPLASRNGTSENQWIRNDHLYRLFKILWHFKAFHFSWEIKYLWTISVAVATSHDWL